jgi:hypothetical protein
MSKWAQPLGRYEHGPFKHGPRTTRHGLSRVRAWHGTAPVLVLGWNPSTRTRHGNDPLQRSARGRHDSYWIRAAPPLLSLNPASPPLLYKGERFLYML